MGRVAEVSVDEAKARLAQYDPALIRMGVAISGRETAWVFETPRKGGDLDVLFLHRRVLDEALGIDEAAVREEKYLRYVRGIDAALGEVAGGGAQVAFLLQPTKIGEVAEVSFGGGVMPQKSTDFYPKLLSGVTIYKLLA
jgi:uncharacterized protein (DUF1015 family)